MEEDTYTVKYHISYNTQGEVMRGIPQPANVPARAAETPHPAGMGWLSSSLDLPRAGLLPSAPLPQGQRLRGPGARRGPAAHRCAARRRRFGLGDR